MNTTAIVEDRQRATWKKAQDDNKAALVKSFLAGDIDHYITGPDVGDTKSAFDDIAAGLALLVVPCDPGWIASVVKAIDYEDEYDCKRFDTIAEAATWGAATLDQLAADVDEAIQSALQDRMLELHGIESTDRNATHPFR